MKPGDVVQLRKAEAFFVGPKVRGSSTYKAPPKKYMVLMMLGIDSDEEPLDCAARLRALGWVPVTDVSRFKPGSKSAEVYKDEPEPVEQALQKDPI